MVAFHYIVEQQVTHETKITLLSASDVKLLIAQDLIQKMEQNKLMHLIAKRHKKRQKHINRFYKE